MGGAIARRIIGAGWATVLWARRAEVLDAFAAPNVTTAATPAALAAATDVIGICVWTDDDVREVVAGVDGVLHGAREGTVLAIHSTVLPATCRELAALAAARGISVIDAPVTGGPNVALTGSLAVAVGGDDAALARCAPVFEAFASSVIRLGDVGAGQGAKLLNNTLFTANLAVADAALTLGEALGLDAAELARFLQSGSGRSYGLEIAQRCRLSPETRAAARPALEKDVESLDAETSARSSARTVLHDAAADGIRRLREGDT
jgi:3-hydroxyisobutyrate dehydrogenase